MQLKTCEIKLLWQKRIVIRQYFHSKTYRQCVLCMCYRWIVYTPLMTNEFQYAGTMKACNGPRVFPANQK